MDTQAQDTQTYLFIDTETTGFFKRGPHIQDDQGRVCQIAMLLTDCVGKSLMEFSALVKPDNWKIGAKAQEIHGFSDIMCEQFGISQRSMVAMYKCAARKASMIVAHNEEFDRNMMDIECAYYAQAMIGSEVDEVKRQWFCTMKPNTHITGGKWPKLEEALQHFCKRSLGNTAHDAMYDVKACRDIFFAMRGITVSS